MNHRHGDHWFGLGAVRERFPGVRAVATPAVIKGMRKWSTHEALQTFWLPRFPGQIPEDNREIADRLFLSPRTVGSHLYRSYPKLGVASRHQLRDVIAQAGTPAAPPSSADVQ